MSPDMGNALFEFAGAYFTWMNAAAIFRDKSIRGVYWPATIFFTLWGLWNLFYYPSLHQWYSFAGGIALVSGNIAWIAGLFFVKDWRKSEDTFN